MSDSSNRGGGIMAAHWKPENIAGTTTVRELLFSNDYRHIALKGIFTAFIMLALGGFFALTFRLELDWGLLAPLL